MLQTSSEICFEALVHTLTGSDVTGTLSDLVNENSFFCEVSWNPGLRQVLADAKVRVDAVVAAGSEGLICANHLMNVNIGRCHIWFSS